MRRPEWSGLRSRPTNRQGMEPAAEFLFQTGNKCLAAQRPAGIGVEAQYLTKLAIKLLAEHLLPATGGELTAGPNGQCEQLELVLASDVGLGARPGIFPGTANEAVMNGLTVDILDGQGQVFVIESGGMKAIIP